MMLHQFHKTADILTVSSKFTITKIVADFEPRFYLSNLGWEQQIQPSQVSKNFACGEAREIYAHLTPKSSSNF